MASDQQRDTRERMERAHAQIAAAAAQSPGLVATAMLEVLVDIACGNNPALREYQRMKIYERVVELLDRPRVIRAAAAMEDE